MKTLVFLLTAYCAWGQAGGLESRTAMIDRLAARVKTRGDLTLDILVLSGGGQMGAWGTGFLRGWKQRTTDSMPAFDLVTGISTGSLMAPFALEGSTESLDQVSELYRNAVDEIKPSIDPLFWVRRTGGILKRDKLERTVSRVLSDEFADKLRIQFRANRQMVIGTAELDAGVGRLWHIGRELNGESGSLAKVRNILIASSAIPGAFAPVELDGQAHIDGGVVTNILLGMDLNDFRELSSRLQAAGVRDHVRVRLWVVVNMWLKTPPKAINARSVKAVKDRSSGMQFQSKQQFQMIRLWELSQAVTAGVNGLSMEIRHTSVPERLAAAPGAEKLFDGPYMRELDKAGFERAASARPWEDLPLDPFARR